MKVVCIGSGNVATHLASALRVCGANITQIWSRELNHAAELATLTGSQSISDLNQIDKSADVFIIAVKDDAIPMIAAHLSDVNGLVLHTSGATGIEVLSSIRNHGVLYPLQTFSKSKQIEFSNVPLCIEASDEDNLNILKSIARKLSSPIYEVDSRRRRILHLAAVFACNFVNHLYVLSNEVISRYQLDFSILKPLIMETAVKVQTELPVNAQTGPAIRGDEQTMIRHQELLNDMPELREIYKTLSDSIKKTHL